MCTDGARLDGRTLEPTSEKVPEPPLEKRGDTAHEERPDSPTRVLSDWTSVEAIVDEILQVLDHANLPQAAKFVNHMP